MEEPTPFDDLLSKSLIPFPRKLSYAASSLIIHPSGLILSVSRKDDPNDLNAPGGKLDPGENFLDACVRETKEETGLTVIQLQPFFGMICTKVGSTKDYWNMHFICKAEGKVQTTEKGRVAWIKPERYISDKNGKRNSFSDYNEKMLEVFCKTKYANNESWFSTVDIDPSLVDDT